MIKSHPIRVTLSAIALSAVALGLSVSSAMAEQIRLSDGRIIQGEVVGQVTDQGFLFKLTRTGGQAFFRWSQVNRDDEARLRNIKDPDADIKLVVYIQGDRINTIFGDAFEGIVEQQADHYLVKSLRNPRGRRVPLDEVQETDGVQKNVLIDARVMHPPLKVLELREEEAPPESAQDWYAAARLAEHLGLYRESQERLAKCLELQPTSKLLEVSEAMKLRLDELVKQEMVLSLLDATRKVADGDAYAQAKYELEESLKGSRMGTKPTGAIKDTIEAQLADVEVAYTKWVIDEWHDYATAAARKWVRENKEATVNEAMQFGRRGLEQELLKEMVKKSRGSLDAKLLQDAVIARDIRDRMALRLNDPWVKRLRNRRADFGRDGWYQAVGGNLPNAGRVKPVNQAAPAPGGQPPRFPGIPGGNPNRPRGGGGEGFGIDDGQDAKDPVLPVAKMDGIQFQEAPPPPQGGGAGGAGGGAGGGAPAGGIGNIDPKALEEIIKRLTGGGNQPEQPSVNEGGPRRPSRRYADDDPRMKVPNEAIPSLQEWWEKLSDSRKTRWIMALYARDSGTMDIVREDYNSISYR